jgi:DNA-binding MarR family transcriptional regulator
MLRGPSQETAATNLGHRKRRGETKVARENYLEVIYQKTGKTLEELVKLAKTAGHDGSDVRPGTVIAWIRAEFGLGDGHAMALTHAIKEDLLKTSDEGPSLMDRTKVPDEPWTRFALSVFSLNGLIIEAGQSISKTVGQTSARWQVLGSVFEPQTVPDIARNLGISRQGVQRVANVLRKEGLVASRKHPTDQRTYLFELTASGRVVLAEIYSRQLEWSLGTVTVLGEDRLRQATAIMDELGLILELEIKKLKKSGTKGNKG